ncbi:hypothetical protein PG993_004915 [Apiospora rasikravindrae]|uniref:Uncharacterized protein n=1 Tax=Apiospora rasikravindrae TaxID=990691 RepID=A0ABR1TE34_9PEZI
MVKRDDGDPALGHDARAVAAGLSFTHHHLEISLCPLPLPAPGASVDTDEIIRQFQALNRSTKWRLVEKVPFEDDTFEPEGMVRLGNSSNGSDDNNIRYLVSADRTAGAGRGHLLIYDGRGKRLGDVVLTSSFRGSVPEDYHLGSLEYDGRYLWTTVSQYRPSTTATLIRLDLSTSSSSSPSIKTLLGPVEPLWRIRDHQGVYYTTPVPRRS